MPYTDVDKHSYIMTFGSPDGNRDECSVSKSRMREIRLYGLVGGLPKQDNLFLNAEGGLP